MENLLDVAFPRTTVLKSPSGFHRPKCNILTDCKTKRQKFLIASVKLNFIRVESMKETRKVRTIFQASSSGSDAANERDSGPYLSIEDPLLSGDGSPPSGNNNNGGSGGDGDGGQGPSNSDSDGEKNLWNMYLKLLEKHPIITKAITAGLLNLIADLICQIIVEKKKDFDIQRLLGFTAIGLFVVGPSLHYWYGILLRVVPISGDLGTIIRLSLDQFIFSPASIAIFFAVILSFEGRQAQLIPKLETDLFPTILALWKLWIPFQFINFKFVPPSLQVASASLVGLLWTVYMSYVSHRDLPGESHSS